MSLDGPITSFSELPNPPEEGARAAIIPAPLEATVSYGHGTALGPAAIIFASQQLELYDNVVDRQTMDLGVITRPAVNVSPPLEAALARIEAAVGHELDAGRLPVLLGGEHTVTVAALRALVKRRGADFTVLSLDAHLDLRDSYEGSPYSHACAMRRALDLGLEVRHIGARSCSLAEMDLIRARGMEPLWAREVHNDPDWLQKAVAGLEGPVYLTLDVDGFDASVMPATGTPEPGGLSWPQVTTWLEAVCARCPVVGLDVVELAPLMGMTAWDFTAAKLVYRALGLALLGGPSPKHGNAR